MVMQDQLQCLAIGSQFGGDPYPDLHVTAHDGPFGVTERSRFGQERFRDQALAHIVKQARDCETIHIRIGKLNDAAEPSRSRADSPAVAGNMLPLRGPQVGPARPKEGSSTFAKAAVAPDGGADGLANQRRRRCAVGSMARPRFGESMVSYILHGDPLLPKSLTDHIQAKPPCGVLSPFASLPQDGGVILAAQYVGQSTRILYVVSA